MERFLKPDENEALLALIGALDAKDAYRRSHASRYNQAAFISHLLTYFKIEASLKQQIYNAILLYDIGMIGISDNILLKPGPLTHDERGMIEQVPQIAADILSLVPSLAIERDMILHQNEHWDGSGYPARLSGKNIPVGSRFIAISRAIDAITNDRPYRCAQPISFCLQEIKTNVGKQFDPAIAKAAASLLCKPNEWKSELPDLYSMIKDDL